MRLTINGEQASYSLENERTLGEVARGVQAWLGASGLLLTGLEADDRDLLTLPAREWAGIPLDGVAELRVVATHTGPTRIEHWRTVQKWLSVLRDEIAPSGQDSASGAGPGGGPVPADGAESRSGEALEDLLAGLPHILASFTANPFLPPGSKLGGRLEAVFAGASAAAVRSWAADRKAEAVGLLDSLAAAGAERLQDALHPEQVLARSARTLRELHARLSEVSVMLQTGRDREAMDVVIRFSEAAHAVIDALPFLAPDAERARLISDLVPILRQLTEAFDARDGILIGDLLEYEVAPRLERITPLLEKGA